MLKGAREREREERRADHRVKPFHKGMKEKDRNAAIPENKFGMSEKKLEESPISNKATRAQSEEGHDMCARVAAARELRWRQWNGNRAIFISISPDLTLEKRSLNVVVCLCN